MFNLIEGARYVGNHLQCVVIYGSWTGRRSSDGVFVGEARIKDANQRGERDNYKKRELQQNLITERKL